MKRELLLTTLLAASLSTFAAETPSDLQRTKIEVETDQIDLSRVYFKFGAGKGMAASSAKPEMYSVKDMKLNIGTKLVVGKVDETGAYGFAIAPDLELKLRFDGDNNKVRLEVAGKVISVFDYQHLFNDKISSYSLDLKKDEIKLLKENKIPEAKKEITKNELLIQKLKSYKNKGISDAEIESGDIEMLKIAGRSSYYGNEKFAALRKNCLALEGEQKVKCFNDLKKSVNPDIAAAVDGFINGEENYVNTIKHDLQTFETQLANLEKELKDEDKKFAHDTIDFSIGNLGIEHKDITEALYKYTGFKGSLLSFSFDLARKSGDIKFGLCGTVDLIQIQGGKYKTKLGEEAAARVGFASSVCGKIGYGPVVLTNTFTAKTNSILDDHLLNAGVDNTARLGITTKIIPGANVELSAHHTYSYEVIGGTKIQSNVVGGGVTVLAK